MQGVFFLVHADMYIKNVSTTQRVILTRWRSHVITYHQLTVKHYATGTYMGGLWGGVGEAGEHWVIHETEFFSD